ncbi:hypothetical protein DPMN_027028 [Dreissena polymorpha]|uniref:Myb/SANT-like DNA-binding domain-containing protein n=1 Tax=Dreissena polymorpha TaxID=45954 RepID=A0A9D4RD37_DREPO|nr:hypothetical protein DPMN_027028 [Dreissena polymorpha]
MNENNVKVTKLQVMNKWKNMRRKYKEVKDNTLKTGSQPINWKHLDAFDELFGHKQSTRPTVTIDSRKTIQPVEIEKEKCQENSNDITVSSDLPGPSKRKRN